MISVIICSVNEQLSAQLSENIRSTIGVADFEVIIINNTQNQYSITQAYNLGAAQAKYPYLCFVHEDILFHTEHWGQNLIKHLSDKTVSLLGVLGNVIKTKCPAGAYSTVPGVLRINHLQKTLSNEIEFYHLNPHSEYQSDVVLLDGMFLATTIEQHKKYPFDDSILKGFHGYDVDYSLGHYLNGRVIVVYDILLEHFSFGSYSAAWADAQLTVIQKWKKHLPMVINGYEKHLRPVELENIRRFLMVLFKYNHKKHVQLLYSLRSARLNFMSLQNFYYFRKVLINRKLEQFLKSFFNR